MKKRVLSILLALVMVLSILPVSGVFAVEAETDSSYWTYDGSVANNVVKAYRDRRQHDDQWQYVKLVIDDHDFNGTTLAENTKVYVTDVFEQDTEPTTEAIEASYKLAEDDDFTIGDITVKDYLQKLIYYVHIPKAGGGYDLTAGFTDAAYTVNPATYAVQLIVQKGSQSNVDMWCDPAVSYVSLANIEEKDRFDVDYTDFFYLGEKDVVDNFSITIKDNVLEGYELVGEESQTPDAPLNVVKDIVDYEYKVVGAKKADAKEDDFILEQYEEFDAEENYTPENPAHCVIFTGNNTNGNYTDYAVLDIVVDDPYVFFESNGGSEVEPQAVVYGEAAVKPVDPTKDGYTFAGWYTDEELTQAYDFATPVTEAIVLYAKWENNPKTGIAGSYTTLIIAGGLLVLAAAAVVVLRKRSTQK